MWEGGKPSFVVSLPLLLIFKNYKMKKAHKYKMKVLFENGKKWDLDILAVDITWLFCWIRSEQNIINLEINLIKKDVEDVKDNYGALDITKNEI